MVERDLKERTKKLALRIVCLYVALPKTTVSQVLGKQLLRSGTSVGAHYREAQRAKFDADSISKIEGGLQELDETCYWLELITEAGIVDEKRIKPLWEEAESLVAIFVTIVKQVKGRINRKKLKV